jgi:hypothetical protein
MGAERARADGARTCMQPGTNTRRNPRIPTPLLRELAALPPALGSRPIPFANEPTARFRGGVFHSTLPPRPLVALLGRLAENRLAGHELEREVALHDLADLLRDLPGLAALEGCRDEQPE